MYHTVWSGTVQCSFEKKKNTTGSLFLNISSIHGKTKYSVQQNFSWAILFPLGSTDGRMK